MKDEDFNQFQVFREETDNIIEIRTEYHNYTLLMKNCIN